MQIKAVISPSFGRRIKKCEEKDYADTLVRARSKAAGGRGKNMLIIPSSSMPQAEKNNTGVGNIYDKESLNFIDFAKKYWGINELQLLPCGQYHKMEGGYPIYSSTSLELGSHMIDIKSILPKEDFKKLVIQNSNKKTVNFENIVSPESEFEKLLRNLHKNIPNNLKNDFEKYKVKNTERLERQAIYNALFRSYKTPDVYNWNETDKNLYNEHVVKIGDRQKRIDELYKRSGEDIDFYYFKQFLADKSLKDAKSKINAKGIKLNSDMICGFSQSEKWAYPDAFLQYENNIWGAPALNLDSQEGIELLRKKVRFNAERFDGFRIDASWTYAAPKYKNIFTNEIIQKEYGDRFLKVIDDEVKKVKGQNYDLKNITHEFAADPKDFNIFEGDKLKKLAADRVKIYTSDFLSGNWGSADIFIKRGWDAEKFILGTTNHDSGLMEVTDQQIDVLSEILKIQPEKLSDRKEFLKAKFAEPLRGRNNMLFFMNALGIDGKFANHKNRADDYIAKVPENYEKFYIDALSRGEGFNPMDALEKQFIAQGFDKTDKKLFKKIQKYKKILEEKEGSNKPILKIAIAAISILTAVAGFYALNQNNKQSLS